MTVGFAGQGRVGQALERLQTPEPGSISVLAAGSVGIGLRVLICRHLLAVIGKEALPIVQCCRLWLHLTWTSHMLQRSM